MAQFPTISFGRAAMYPLTRTSRQRTTVLLFVGDQEQRWVSQKPVQQWQLVFTDVDGYSISVLREFWAGQGGASTSEFDLALGGTTYHHLVFVDDSFRITQNKANRFTVTMNVRQTRAQ